jgi:GT2 family glycosyltransferase/glycosyltransferase involved in cell wall biosynthesis
LVLGQERWDEVKRRNQLLLSALAQRNPRTRILFVEQPHRPRELARWRWPQVVRVAPNIWRLAVLRPLPDRLSQSLADAAEAWQIQRGVRAVGLVEPFIWSQDPRAADLLDRLDHAGLIFDMTDDWTAFETEPDQRDRVQRQTARLAREATAVLACSEPLSATARALGAEPVYLPNAVDPIKDTPEVPASLAALASPRLGYVGTLHSSRIDVELIVAAAALRPAWSFPLVGPNLLEAGDAARLLDLPNVHYLGSCAHAEVPGFLAGFDLGLIPNRVSQFTASLNPLKAYQYLAAGLPVLATPVGVPRELASAVTVVADAAALIGAAEALLAQTGAAAAAARRELVAGDTWDARAKVIETALGLTPPARESDLVTVVVVSFNTRELLVRCLDALAEDGYPHLQTIVVDNASSDGTPALVRERYPEVELVALDANLGFGAANNVGLRQARGEFVLALNSDAFLHPGAITALVAAARRHPEAGVLGPRLLNPDQTLQRSAWPFPAAWRLLMEAVGLHRLARCTPLYEDLATWDHQQERAVDFMIGACLLLRASAILEVGGFDERFWMYAEEADLQRRMSARGWIAMLAPDATVTHIGGGSSRDETARLKLFYAGQLRFLAKHRSAGAALGGRLALLIGALVRGRWRAAAVALSSGGSGR